MKTVLKKSASYYNPMSINGIVFDNINIVDGDKVLHQCRWFTKSIHSSNACDEGIYFHGIELKRSKLAKNKLRYQGIKGKYELYIDISIMPIEQVAVIEDKYHNEISTSVNTYYRVQGLEAYFYDRKKLPQTKQQKAYESLYNKLDNERLNTSDLKRYLEFYKNNTALCIASGVKV